MQKTQNLQDLFLNQARRDRQLVTVFLVYKHAISTLIPAHPVDLTGGGAL